MYMDARLRSVVTDVCRTDVQAAEKSVVSRGRSSRIDVAGDPKGLVDGEDQPQIGRRKSAMQCWSHAPLVVAGVVRDDSFQRDRRGASFVLVDCLPHRPSMAQPERPCLERCGGQLTRRPLPTTQQAATVPISTMP